MNNFIELIVDAIVDSVKMLPFLFAAYLLIEYLEHRASGKIEGALKKFGRLSPVAGAATGLVPQCGFSVTAANLYAGRVISFGTLAAVFIATSDEAVPILLSHPEQYGYIWKLLLIKFLIAAAAGLTIDALLNSKPSTVQEKDEAHKELHGHCSHSCCDHGILKPSIKHTLKSWAFIFITMLALNFLIYFVGDEVIASFVGGASWLQPAMAVLVGLIPNCASSIMLTELFAGGALSFGSLVAGLVANSGVGLLYLFRTNHDLKKNLSLTGILMLIGLLSGYVVGLLPL